MLKFPKKSANKINFILSIIFLLLVTTLTVIAVLKKPRVLVLHSYATDYSWVNDINKGILRRLDKYSYNMRWHYMDTKRHPSEHFKQRAGASALAMIDEWDPHIIIAVDDNAQKWVTRHLIDHPKIKIVFTGVNGTLEDYGFQDAKNVTGVLERLPFEAFRTAFIDFLGDKGKKIVHISDNSTTSTMVKKELDKINWQPLDLVKSIKIDTFEEWKKEVNDVNDNADFLLITHYHTLKYSAEDQRMVPPIDVVKWTEENTNIPIVGSWGFFVEDGGSMAIAVSPFEQGEEAAQMAINLLAGEEIHNIPIKTGKLFMLYIREEGMKRRNISVPLLFESFARATDTYY